MRCQRATFFSDGPVSRATHRWQGKNRISDAPASVHFCTMKSARSPLGSPAKTVTCTLGSPGQGTVSKTSASTCRVRITFVTGAVVILSRPIADDEPVSHADAQNLGVGGVLSADKGYAAGDVAARRQ